MSSRRRWAIGAAVATVLAGALFVPDPDPDPDPPDGRPFVWGQDDLWSRLEGEFDAAREAGCAAQTPAIDEGLADLDARLDALEADEVAHDDPRLRALEEALFTLATRFGACTGRVPELADRVGRLRRVVKAHSRGWDIAGSRPARDRLYRLLYGSRAALEELLLQMDEAPGLLRGTAEPSQAPSVELHGVTVHSGDILASRGGAPTSAFIARGNDYPGNFSHIALLHVSEDGEAHVIESHIESGVGVFDAEHYLSDTKLRIMVLRLRADHPALADDPALPHRAATEAMEAARDGHIPYDFEMDYADDSELFCSEVAYAAYHDQGVDLWEGLSSMSGEGLTRWLSRFGVTHFETLGPSDIEYDPQLTVVAEWRDPETLFDDHIDNAVLDVMLEGAERGDDIEHDAGRLPLARIAKGYSLLLNVFGSVGPIPEGMSATTGLRVEWLRERHGAIRAGVEERVEAYRAEHDRRPPYWTLVEMAREAAR